MTNPNNKNKDISITELDKTINHVEKKIHETNEFLKNYNSETFKNTDWWPFVLIIMTGYMILLILFFIDNFVA